ncbi:alpha/beta hydrolase family esterase [Nonomuraea sp. NPDC050556]|uniref:alpha/beta hydrolase family esterase n=1 Tax=Nonomuraea sp. NPDC050556 TaxID=3364369 RepID=UPI0037A272FB
MLRRVLAALLLLSTGCTGVSVATSPQPLPTTDCSSLRSGEHSLTFAGKERRFLLSVPKGKGPHPVLLNLHGLGSNADQQAAYSGLPQAGRERGYVVATPQSDPDAFGWGLPGLAGPDDAGFLAALLDLLERRLCVDKRREFAAGMSMGAGMSTGLICGLRGRLAGVAPVAGINIVTACDKPEPTTIVAFHGTADTVVPYKGGHPFAGRSGRLSELGQLITLAPVVDSVRAWAGGFGCGKTRTRGELREWTGCAEGVVVRLYTLKGGGHTWPGARPVARLGPTDPLPATKLILDAFDAVR